MPLVDRHHDIVEDGEAEARPELPFHQGEIQADAHAVLVPLAVVGRRRKHAFVVEGDLQIELAF